MQEKLIIHYVDSNIFHDLVKLLEFKSILVHERVIISHDFNYLKIKAGLYGYTSHLVKYFFQFNFKS